METKARYVLVGLFALFVIAGVFGFVYWLETIGGSGERVVYRIHFERTVSGLRVGSAVLFNGLRVGEVTGLALDLDNPRASPRPSRSREQLQCAPIPGPILTFRV